MLRTIRRTDAASGVVIGSLLLLLTFPAVAQRFANLLPAQSGAQANTAQAQDPLGRTDPRSAVYNFLEACHSQRFLRAAQYLDLSKLNRNDRVSQGPQLARELGELLDRDPRFELTQLSNAPDGRPDDGLPINTDALDSFELENQVIPLNLQRESQNGANVWLVDADSVARIPELSTAIAGPAIEKSLPPPLVKIKLLGTPLWVWIALLSLALLLSFLSKLLSKWVLAAVRPITRHYATSFQNFRLLAFTEPLRLLLAVAVFRACMAVIAPSALLRDYLLHLLSLLTVFGTAAVVMRIADVVSDQIISRLDPRQRALSYSVVPLGVRFVKICVFCLALLITLANWGYNTSTILAGVGVGGLAIALAAQKTIENLFGGVSVISDRPVLVGDVCQFGGQTGTVEDIGLRSTRIRTPERTLVTIPNATFSTMTLENLSQRDRMLFHPTLQLRRDTTPEQIRDIMDGIVRLLKEHPAIDPTDVPVRFTKITPESFNLEIFSYVLTRDGNEFLRTQSDLLLKLLDLAAQLNIGLAVPFQESGLPGQDSDGAVLEHASNLQDGRSN